MKKGGDDECSEPRLKRARLKSVVLTSNGKSLIVEERLYSFFFALLKKNEASFFLFFLFFTITNENVRLL